MLSMPVGSHRIISTSPSKSISAVNSSSRGNGETDPAVPATDSTRGGAMDPAVAAADST